MIVRKGGRGVGLREALLGVAVVGLIAGACAHDSHSRCPTRSWCGPASAAETVAEPVSGATFTCPIDVHAGVAREAGAAPPPALPVDRLVTLDEEATRGKREAGEASTCCYAWTEACER